MVRRGCFSRARLAPLAIAVGLAAGGCSEPPADLGPGESCVRSSQCADGLACVAGQCASELGGLLEAGMVPELMDAGAVMMMDAGDLDGGAPPMDSGPPPPMDSGPPPPMDSGPPPPMDSGPPPDSGSSGTDAGAGTDGG